jgi:hypothetical protein
MTIVHHSKPTQQLTAEADHITGHRPEPSRSGKGGAHHASQTARIVELLRSRHGAWVPLPEILDLRIAQFSARIHHARHVLGLRIENRTEMIDGVRHSWFRLVEPASVAPGTQIHGACPSEQSADGGAN